MLRARNVSDHTAERDGCATTPGSAGFDPIHHHKNRPNLGSFVCKTTLLHPVFGFVLCRFRRQNPSSILRNIFMVSWIRISHLASFCKNAYSWEKPSQPASRLFRPSPSYTFLSYPDSLTIPETPLVHFGRFGRFGSFSFATPLVCRWPARDS